MLKVMLCFASLLSVFSGNQPVFAVQPSAECSEQAVSPRIWGTLTSSELTSTDGKLRVRLTYTHEIGTNTIVYINGIASVSSSRGYVSDASIISSSINQNRAAVNIRYIVNGTAYTAVVNLTV